MFLTLKEINSVKDADRVLEVTYTGNLLATWGTIAEVKVFTKLGDPIAQRIYVTVEEHFD